MFVYSHTIALTLRLIPKANIPKSFYPPALIVCPPNIPYSDNIIIIITVCLLYGVSFFVNLFRWSEIYMLTLIPVGYLMSYKRISGFGLIFFIIKYLTNLQLLPKIVNVWRKIKLFSNYGEASFKFSLIAPSILTKTHNISNWATHSALVSIYLETLMIH